MRLRCCGRFCYWRVPLGPWQCSVCERLLSGPMPKSAEARFWRYVEKQLAGVEWARRQRVQVSSPHFLFRAVLEGLDDGR